MHLFEKTNKEARYSKVGRQKIDLSQLFLENLTPPKSYKMEIQRQNL